MSKALLTSVRSHPWSAVPEPIRLSIRAGQLAELVDHAVFHGVAGCLWRSTEPLELAVSPATIALRTARDSALAKHLRALRAVGDVGALLDHAGIRWAVLKGPALAHGVYESADLRSYDDLDVLVDPEEYEGAIRALHGGGVSLEERDWDHAAATVAGETRLHHPLGVPIDLHWATVNTKEWRDGIRLSAGDLLSRRRALDLPSGSAWTLDDADNLIYLCVHAALHGADRLKWFKDLEQLMRARPIAWDVVDERSVESGTSLIVRCVLDRFERAFQLGGPWTSDDSISQIDRAWQWFCATGGRLPPVERAAGGRSVARLVMRSTRCDAGSSAARLLRSAGAAARPWRGRLPTTRGGSMERYLEEVRRATG